MAREMKDSGIAWIGTIPLDWKISRVKNECFNLDYLREPISAEKRDNELGLYDYYGASGIIDKIDRYNVDDTVLLIGEDGANLRMRNLPLVYRASGKFWVNNHAHILKVKPYNDYSYFAYLLESGDYTVHITGTAQPKLSQSNLMSFYIVTPPLIEQKKIGEYLDTQCAEIDAILEKIRLSIEEYKKLKQAIITQAVTKGIRGDRPMKDSGIIWLGDVPESWNISKIKHTIFPHEKPVLPTDEVITCFRDGTVTLRKNKREEGYTISFTEKGYQGVDIGDLVIHGMDTFAGAIGCSDSRGKTSPVVHVCSTSGNNRYFMYFLRYMAFSNVLMDFSNGVRIRSSDFRNFDKLAVFEVLAPPLNEQNEIADYLDDCSIKIGQMIAQKERLIKEIETYKKSLIYEYVTGKKEVLF